MTIREYSPADLNQLRSLHARQGFQYAFPDLADPLFVTKLVADDEAGRITLAALGRLTCEAYLLADPAAGSPQERWQGIIAIAAAAEADAARRGLADAHAWLPPSIARQFGRRLARLGWVRDDAWTPYCKRLV